MKDLKLLSPAAAAASAYASNNHSYVGLTIVCFRQKNFKIYLTMQINVQIRQKDQVITADAAAAATLLLRFVPSTNFSLKLAASVRLSLARSSPSVMY